MKDGVKYNISLVANPDPQGGDNMIGEWNCLGIRFGGQVLRTMGDGG